MAGAEEVLDVEEGSLGQLLERLGRHLEKTAAGEVEEHGCRQVEPAVDRLVGVEREEWPIGRPE